MATKHHFPLGAIPPQKSYSKGFRSDATTKNFPALKGMALSLLQLEPQGFREPHWHPNAHELSYCIEGTARMTIFSPGAIHDTFIIRPGDIAFVPMGSLHHIENIGNGPIKMLICFTHEEPEDFELSASVRAMPPHALAATFREKDNFFETIQRSGTHGFIEKELSTMPLSVSEETSRLKLNLEGLNPFIKNSGGTVKISNNFFLPALQGIAVYSLILNENGVREPHWHPNAAELNYLIQGHVRINLFLPDGTIDAFELKAGDISFLPRGYIHHIENLGKEEVRMAVFFNNESPSDIGISGCLGAYPNATLSALFGVAANYFDTLPKYQRDLFVVSGAG